MKNPITVIALLSMLSLFSCSKVIYSNEQAMNEFKTKESIIKKLGLPDEKRTAEDGEEEWLYKYDTGNSRASYSIVQNPDANTNVVNFSMYKRYIKFRMDAHGNVLSWQCEGVDFAKRQARPVQTVALIAGIAGLIIGLTSIIVNSIHVTYNPFNP
ncbi:MAG TPA: hypothetical protein VIM16_15335 [Mucilaginibacter sp.]|jgi:hypothetical protein